MMPDEANNEAKQTNHQAIFDKLLKGWKGKELNYRPGYSTAEGFRVFLYIDKDSIQQRLDDVLGPTNWRASYRHDLDATICKLALCFDGEWCWKEGVGGKPKMEKEQDAVKGAATDAFRQAADAWGFGRYLSRLPVIFWAANVQNGKWKSWQNEQGLRAAINNATEGRAPAPPAGHTASSNKPPTQATPAKKEPTPKPEQGIARESKDLLTPALRTSLENFCMQGGIHLAALIKREFQCTIDELSKAAASWLYKGLTDGWLEHASLVKVQISELDEATLAAMAEPERAGYHLAHSPGCVVKEGEHYTVSEGGLQPPRTVWKTDGVTQCDCGQRRKTKDAPMCRHIHAVSFFAAASQANGKAASATTKTPARATN